MRLSVVLSIIAVWGFALVNDSGLGKLFYTEEKMNWLIVICSIYLWGIRKRTFIPKMRIDIVLCFLLFFIFSI